MEPVRCPDHRSRLLIGLAVGLALAEAIALRLLGPVEALALAPQVSAPPPYGVLHDLRWVLTFHNGWATFVGATVLAFAFRTAIVTAMVQWSWPLEADRRSWREAARQAAVGTAVGAVAVLVPALLLFALSAFALSWLLFAGVALVIPAAVLSHHAAVVPGWWRRLPPWQTAGWAALEWLLLTAGAAAIVLAPAWVGVGVAGLVGWANALVWRRIVARLALVVPERRVPVTPLALAALYAAVIVAFFFGFSAAGGGGPGSEAGRAQEGQIPVLLAAGFSSSYDGTVATELGDDFLVWRYSYLGLGPDGRPLPYRSEATHRPIDELARAMEQQVEALHEATGRKVFVVASSAGSVVARTYLAAADDPPVAELLMMSPLVRPARVYYPPPGDSGWGVATGWGLRALGGLTSALTGFDTDPDLPFLRSLITYAPALRAGMTCPSPDASVVGLVPVATATAIPVGEEPAIPVRTVSGFHGSAIETGEIERTLVAHLQGDPPDGGAWGWTATAIRAGAAAWHAPELPLGLNPVWDDGPTGGCAAALAAFHRWDPLRAEP